MEKREKEMDIVKNNKINEHESFSNNLLEKKSGWKMKSTVFLATLFLSACQTISQQSESMDATKNAHMESSRAENLATEDTKTIALESRESEDTDQILSEDITLTRETKSDVKEPMANKPDYIQTRPPMSEATRERLKGHAKKLINKGSIPQMNYQQPAAPGLSISLEQKPAITAQENKTTNNATMVQLNYEQTEIRKILDEFADALNMTIVIDPSITGAITMRTAPDSSLTQKDLWPLLQMLLNEAGVVLEKNNGIYHAKRAQQLLPATIGRSNILDNTEAPLVMQITPLKHISIEAVLTVLKPIVGPKGRIVPVANLNTLLIVDKPGQLKRINGLLTLIDADPFKHRGIHLYKINAAEAKKVAKELKDILKLIEGNKPAYQVMGLERINALLVVAPPGRGFKEVSRWVDILDAGGDEELVEQIFIYKCKSLKATSLASTLNSIFDQDDKDKKKDNKEEVSKPNEFKTVSKEALSFEKAVKREANKKKDVVNKPKTAAQKAKKATTDEVASANINVTIVADEDSNSLLVRTTGRDYKQLLETIRALDVVPLQVLINVVIAQVTLTDSQSFGIDWSYLGSAQTREGGSGTNLLTNFGQASSVSDSGEPFGLIVSRLTGDWRVTLNALAKESDVNILSRPSLLITNNQEGIINVGQEVPVETSNTTNNNSSTEDAVNVTQQIAYRKTGIELTVTPQINEDGMVNMVVQQGLSSIEGQTEGGDVGLNPTFSNQEISTTVVVRDNETIILGGLIQTREIEQDSGVPLLMDIPIMGNLFKTQGNQVERRELILIISTNIVNAVDSYEDFNNNFKSRYRSAARYIDEQLNINFLKENEQ